MPTGSSAAEATTAWTAAWGPTTSAARDEKDTVTYEDRTNQVFVTLDGRANDGENGEGDNVLPDVEVILGGFGGRRPLR